MDQHLFSLQGTTGLWAKLIASPVSLGGRNNIEIHERRAICSIDVYTMHLQHNVRPREGGSTLV